MNAAWGRARHAADVGPIEHGVSGQSLDFFRLPAGSRSPPVTKAAELLGEQDIVLGMPARGKRSALARIATSLGQRVGMDQGPVLAAMLRRERLGSTGIGHGVAIPHARLDEISTPALMVATLRHPVWFASPDGDPVDMLLAVLWPRSDSVVFLPALAGFCRLFRHSELRDRIRASKMPAEVLAWMEFFEERAAETASIKTGGTGHMRPSTLMRKAHG